MKIFQVLLTEAELDRLYEHLAEAALSYEEHNFKHALSDVEDLRQSIETWTHERKEA